VSGNNLAFAQQSLQELNDEGCRALKAGNFDKAIQKFKTALAADPGYQIARDNLAIAYNNYGFSLQKTPREALKKFHVAKFLAPNNKVTDENIAGIIRLLGRNPASAADRAALGDEARLSGDFEGAIVEYDQSVKLSDSAKIRVKLGDVFRVRDKSDSAIQQYIAASKLGDSAEIETKLGQAYQAKGDIPQAISAFGKAIQLGPDDLDVQDALVSGWEAAVAANPLSPDNHIGLGQAFQYRGDFGQAKAEFTLAINCSPGKDNTVAKKLLAGMDAAAAKATTDKYTNAGVDAQTRGQFDAAIELYDKALKVSAGNVDALVNKATALQTKGDLDNAIACYESAIKLAPNNMSAQQGLKTATAERLDKIAADSYKAGGDFFSAGKFKEALNSFEQVLKVNPDDSVAHFSRGATLQAMGNLDGAIGEYLIAHNQVPEKEQFAQALDNAYQKKADPLIAEALKNYSQKNYETAVSLYTQAAALCPKNGALWYNIAGAEYAFEHYDRARTAYLKALELDPKGLVDSLFFISTIDDNNGKGVDALSGYKKYVAKAPKGSNAGAARSRIDALIRDIGKTEKIPTEAERRILQDADEFYNQAVKLQEASKYDDAIASYLKAIDKLPKNPAYRYSLGTAFQAKKDFDLAIQSYQKAIELEPGNKDYRQVLAQARASAAIPLLDSAIKKQTTKMDDGKYDYPGAIKDYEAALKLDGSNATAYMNAGTAYQANGDWKLAVDAYSQALKLSPEMVDLYYFRASVLEQLGEFNRALHDYNEYLRRVPTGGNASFARERIKALMDVR
jgi:tetratricopeptide (TPR) repeat protein